MRVNSIQDVIEVLRDIVELDCVLVHQGSITCADCVKSDLLATARYLRNSCEVASACDHQDFNEYDSPACCDSCLNLINYSDWVDWLESWDYHVSREALVSAIEYYGGSLYKRNKPFYQPSNETLQRYARMLIES